MPEVNWNLGVTPDIGGNALRAFEFGRQNREQTDHRNALLQLQRDELSSRNADREADNARRAAEAREKQMEAGREAVANAAFDIIQTPPEQRAAKWDAYVTRFNMPELAGQYSDELLYAKVAEAGLTERLQRFMQPSYEAVGEGGLAGFQFGQPIQQNGQPQDFGPPAAPGITFTPLEEGGPGGSPSGAGF